jgi:hypothetical protein
MSMSITEIESAIKDLPPDEFSELSEWFEKFESEVWEKQIEEDLRTGRLQALIEEAEEDFAEKNYKAL